MDARFRSWPAVAAGRLAAKDPGQAASLPREDQDPRSARALRRGQLGGAARRLLQRIQVGVIIVVTVRQVLEFPMYPEVLLGAAADMVLERAQVFLRILDRVVAGKILERRQDGMDVCAVVEA